MTLVTHLHLGDVGEVPGGDLVLLLDAMVDLRQVGDKLLLLPVLPEHRRHLLLQRADDVGLHLDATHTHTHKSVSSSITFLCLCVCTQSARGYVLRNLCPSKPNRIYFIDYLVV